MKKRLLLLILIILIIKNESKKEDEMNLITTNGVINTNIKKSKEKEYLIGYIWVGTPRKKIQASIDFSHGNLIILNEINQWSVSFSQDRNKMTDLIEISNRIFRLNISLTIDNTKNYQICDTCEAILGLGKKVLYGTFGMILQ